MTAEDTEIPMDRMSALKAVDAAFWSAGTAPMISAGIAYTLLARVRIDPMSIGDLARVTGLDASTLNRQTSALRRDGLVTRIGDPQGGRSRKFRITSRGEALYQRQRGINIDALHRVLSGWSAEDVERFATLLTSFNRGVEEVSGRVWEDPAPTSPPADVAP